MRGLAYPPTTAYKAWGDLLANRTNFQNGLQTHFANPPNPRKTHHETVVVHVQNQVLAHDGQSNEGDVSSAKERNGIHHLIGWIGVWGFATFCTLEFIWTPSASQNLCWGVLGGAPPQPLHPSNCMHRAVGLQAELLRLLGGSLQAPNFKPQVQEAASTQQGWLQTWEVLGLPGSHETGLWKSGGPPVCSPKGSP